jgi:hypothetical protein
MEASYAAEKEEVPDSNIAAFAHVFSKWEDLAAQRSISSEPSPLALAETRAGAGP